MKKVSVIGGAGFIGTRLCQLLHEKGEDFEVLDLRSSPLYPERSKELDICDYLALREAVTGNVIVHLAAVHRDDVSDNSLYRRVNVDGTSNVCRVAEELEVDQIVFTSSVAVYGFAEPGTGEEGPIKPFNDYGKTKYEAEQVLRSWKSEGECRGLIIIRPTVVFGEGNRGNVYNLLNQIAKRRFLMIGKGENKKSMAYVGNVAAFLLSAINFVERPGSTHTYNFIDEPTYSMNELVSSVRMQLLNKQGVGIRVPYSLGIVMGYIADLAALVARKSLPISSVRVRKFCSSSEFHSQKHLMNNFESPVSMEDALKLTVESEFISPDPRKPVFFTE